MIYNSLLEGGGGGGVIERIQCVILQNESTPTGYYCIRYKSRFKIKFQFFVPYTCLRRD